MHMRDIFPAWLRIARGYRPFLSIEMTRECPLNCPGCYAHAPGHSSRAESAETLTEYRGDELVERVMSLIGLYRPLHVSLVGGEPLVRYREVTRVLEQLAAVGMETQVVTSAFRPIPEEWKKLGNLHLVVSIDGLPTEHDVRRAPATYDRVLKNIDGHELTVHCTILPQFLEEPGYLEEFVRLWSLRKNVRKIWFSLFTPQKGDLSVERLTAGERLTAVERIRSLTSRYPKLYASNILLQGFRQPPASPRECIFAQVTQCVSSDMVTPVSPCQIGGNPECRECGCIASAGMAALGAYKIGGILKVADIFTLSKKLGENRHTR
jgi:sulfatase maturation enzyme AslB (radical SAM superfamily)